jgi:predicted P-loop ATPase
MDNKQYLVSYYNSVKSEKSKDIPIADFFEKIRKEEFKVQCDKIRSINDKKLRDEQKLKYLSCITTSGTFEKGHNTNEIIKHSGLIQIDIDKLPIEQITELTKQLKNDKFVFALFLSPSGNGLKIIFKIPTKIEIHLQSFFSIENYFLKVYNQQIDKSCKDLCRLMFISSDTNIYSNFESEIFTDLYLNIKSNTKNSSQKVQLTNDVYADIENCIIQIEERQIDITNNYEEWLKIGFALSDSIGEKGREFYHRISHISSKYNSIECDIQYSKCIKGQNKGISKGTFFKICQDYGVNITSQKNTNVNLQKDDKIIDMKIKPLSRFVQVKNFLDTNFDFRYNIISNEIEYKSKDASKYTSCNENNIYSFLEHNNCSISISKLTILLRSDFVSEYNHFDDYFKNLVEYNPLLEEDFISKLCGYLYAIDKERFATQFRKMLVRSVACALDENVFNKQAFILVHSQQNSGKSTFCRWLCPPTLNNHITENINTDKDSLIALAENFIINLDELATLSKTEINTLKSFFSKDKIKVRRPYDKNPVSVPRRANFVGSTNNQEFLTDYTGSVRWLCFEIEKIDWNYRKDLNINDIWRQSYYLYKQGFKYELSYDELAQNEIANAAFTIHTSELELITKHFERCNESNSIGNFYTATDVLQLLQNKYGLNMRLNIQSIGKALKFLGFVRTKRYINSSQAYGYILHEIPNNPLF